MNIGMLWFDNDTKVDLNSKIHRAAGYYKDKYGRKPNLCYIHPTMTGKPDNKSNDSSSMRAGDIEVRTTRSVLPNHIWIGVNHANGTAPTAGG